jgi:hypothetical protein
MTLFSLTFLQILIFGALGLTATGLLTLIGLLLRDLMRGDLW